MLEHLAQRGGAQGRQGKPTKTLSLDQLLAEKIGRDTRFPSLRMGSGGISWSRAGVRLPTMGNPKEIFAELFLEDNPKLKAKRKQYLSEDASILDAVLEDTRSLSLRLSRTDQEKLNEYLTSIRDARTEASAQVGMDHVPKPKADSGVIDGDDENFVDLAYPYNTSVMYELMALALQANLTNAITFGHPGGNRLFPFDGITYGYHSLTHHGKRPDLLKELTIIETFYTKQFAGFLDLLKKNKDSEDRPLLDSTVVMFGSGMGNASSHSSRNLPVMVTGGGLKGGNHHRFERKGRDGRPLCDLYVPFFRNLALRPTGSPPVRPI